MKNSVLFLILIIGLVILGFIVERRNGAVTNFLGQYEIFDFLKKDNVSGEFESYQIQNEENQEIYRVSIDNLPEGFSSLSGRSIPSSFTPFEMENTAISKTDGNWIERVLTISQYFSKSDFDEVLSSYLDINSRPIDEDNEIVYSLLRNLQIDGNEASHHLISVFYDDGERRYEENFISIPSKLTIISYEYNLDFPEFFVYTQEEIQNIISLIKFDNNSDNRLTSAEKLPEQQSNKSLITQESDGISIDLPQGISIVPMSGQLYVELGNAGHMLIHRHSSLVEYENGLKELMINSGGASEEGLEFKPVYTSVIDGEQATHHDISFNGVEFYQTVIPSKFVTIIFVSYGTDPNFVEYTMDDIRNIISSIKFNY